MRIEVAYARRACQWLRVVELDPGATAADAVQASGLTEAVPGLDPAAADLGIFGQPCAPSTPLRPGDRVEVYRPLQVDPKAARRRRAGR